MTEETAKKTSRDDLQGKVLADLHLIAAEAGVEGYRLLRKEELIDRILERSEVEAGTEILEVDVEEAKAEKTEAVPEPIKADEFWESELEPVEPEVAATEEEPVASGILDLRPDGFGLLRVHGYVESRDDVYVSASQVRRLSLKPGDLITGPLRAARRGEKHSALRRIDAVNGVPEAELPETIRFEKLQAVTPSGTLDVKFGRAEGKSLKPLVPLAKGARMLLLSKPGIDASAAVRELGKGLAAGKSDCQVFALLIDVPPEVSAEWQGIEGIEVASATYDVPRRTQRQIAELALERAKRLVEFGKDAILLVDCISDLGRAYGSDLNGLHRTKRFFGSGRCIADAKGSLTVVATLREDSELLSDKALAADLLAISTVSARIEAE